MKVLVIGSGAREHALCRSLSLDSAVSAVYCAPGNAGIAQVAELRQVDALNAGDVADLAQRLGVDLVVVGPEAPLVAGVADAVRARGIDCFGPSGTAARLEGSKAFAKEVMAAAGVPTARSYVCTTAEEAERALDAFGPPYVVKDDGLAAGKGVVVTDDLDVARAHAASCDRVVIEEFLDGPEVSLFVLCDGDDVVALQPAQDFKRVGDEDAGPNTGGMGAYTPLPWAPQGLTEDLVRTVAQPTVDEMRRRGTPFSGVLFIGLALTSRGPRVIEYNCRFGDPETQVVLASLATPLAGVLHAAATGRLGELEPLRWHEGAAVTVVVAAENYPATPRTGDPIKGLAEVAKLPHTYVLHGGTRRGEGGEVLSSGGRVLSITGTGATLEQARHHAYEGVALIGLPGSHHRTDIAAKASRGEISVAGYPPQG
ncbi:phosphoribosylamine--glycine ligase [Embleya scabrispora]|uniref:Phosphoribosylamine--glycine ligase n=1 Tax=Embleya scabrispora TaxID=159449 RepID=A0A1T3NYY3_9ACTN|nr:phosphoribosylamine--glycine ligase [Embleya scabrispora]OPC81881.1 phosphoribosylamine--glycine ligase [Embleya scabrispora]